MVLPTLVERPEDLRALSLEALARAGLEKDGRPLGLDTSALRLLSDHDWPGNDRELEDVLSRAALARSVRGDAASNVRSALSKSGVATGLAGNISVRATRSSRSLTRRTVRHRVTRRGGLMPRYTWRPTQKLT